MLEKNWRPLLLILVAVLLLFTNLGGPMLWDRDEPRNANCAREMLAAGDWVTPMFNGELRDAKPVMLYWLIMSAYAMFGETEFAARFWSAALCLGTVAATYVTARRLFNSHIAFWSGLALASCAMFNVAGHAATPDSPLIFFTAMSMMVYVLAVFPARSTMHGHDGYLTKTPAEPSRWFPRQWWAIVALYSLMSLGVLTKGPVGMLLPCAVIGLFMLIMRLPRSNPAGDAGDRQPRRKLEPAPTATAWKITGMVVAGGAAILGVEWLWGTSVALLSLVAAACVIWFMGKGSWLSFLKPFSPLHFLKTCYAMHLPVAVLLLLLIAAPWFVWVGLRTDGEFLMGFFVKEHFGRATHAMENHSGLMLFYPVGILVGFFPWSVFAAPLIADLYSRLKNGAGPWRNAYIFALCWIGVYVGVFSCVQTKLPSYVTPMYPAIAMLMGCFMYRWTHSALAAPHWVHKLGVTAFGAVGLIILIGSPFAAAKFLPGAEWVALIGLAPLAGSGACLWLLEGRWKRQAPVAFALSSVLLTAGVFGFALTTLSNYRKSPQLFEAAHRNSDAPELATFASLEPSWVFYFGKQIREFKPHEVQQAKRFLELNPDSFLIVTDRHYGMLKDGLPRDVTILERTSYFLERKQLILLGRDRQVKHTVRRPAQRKFR